RLREFEVEFFLELLGAVAHRLQSRRRTYRTRRRYLFAITTVVAYQRVTILMVREANGAVHTLRYPATVFTTHHRRVAASVLEDDHLFTLGESLLNVSE